MQIWCLQQKDLSSRVYCWKNYRLLCSNFYVASCLLSVCLHWWLRCFSKCNQPHMHCCFLLISIIDPIWQSFSTAHKRVQYLTTNYYCLIYKIFVTCFTLYQHIYFLRLHLFFHTVWVSFVFYKERYFITVCQLLLDKSCQINSFSTKFLKIFIFTSVLLNEH